MRIDARFLLGPLLFTSTFLLIACGGGGSTPPPPVPDPTCSITVNPATIMYGQATTVSYTSANTTYAVINPAIGVVQSNASGSQSVTPTSTTTYTMNVSNTSPKQGSCSATVTVNRKKMGGGTLTLEFDPSFPSSVPDFYSGMQPEQALACGSASDSSAVKVMLDRTQVTSYFSASLTDPTIMFNSLPVDNAGANAGEWYEMLTHESSHARQNSAMLPPFGGLTLGLLEGYATGCTLLVELRLDQKGQNVLPYNPGNPYFMLALDTWRGMKPETLLGPSSHSDRTGNMYYLIGQAAFILQATSSAPAGTTAGDWSKYSIAPFEESLFQQINAMTAPAPLSKDDLVAIFNATGTKIDGQAPGTWAANTPLLLDDAFPAGTFLFAMTDPPVNPNWLSALLFSIDASRSVVQHAASVTFTVSDLTGAVVATATVNTPGGGSVSQLATLPAGIYKAVGTAIYNGVTYTSDPVIFPVVPTAYLPSGQFAMPLSAPGMYFVTVDAKGNPVNASIQVLSGHLVWAGPGVAIVDADPINVIPATVTISVNNSPPQTFTQPRPWTRLIPVR